MDVQFLNHAKGAGVENYTVPDDTTVHGFIEETAGMDIDGCEIKMNRQHVVEDCKLAKGPKGYCFLVAMQSKIAGSW